MSLGLAPGPVCLVARAWQQTLLTLLVRYPDSDYTGRRGRRPAHTPFYTETLGSLSGPPNAKRDLGRALEIDNPEPGDGGRGREQWQKGE